MHERRAQLDRKIKKKSKRKNSKNIIKYFTKSEQKRKSHRISGKLEYRVPLDGFPNEIQRPMTLYDWRLKRLAWERQPFSFTHSRITLKHTECAQIPGLSSGKNVKIQGKKGIEIPHHCCELDFSFKLCFCGLNLVNFGQMMLFDCIFSCPISSGYDDRCNC